MRKALSIDQADQNLWHVLVKISSRSYYAYSYQGKVREGFASSLEALESAEISGDIHSRAMGHVFHGISCFYKGCFAAAEDHGLKGVDLCERMQSHSYTAICHQSLGYTYFEKGDYDKTRIHYQKAIRFRQKSGIYPSCIDLNKMALARAAIAAGQTDLDIPSLVQLLKSNRAKLYHGRMACHLADILLRLGETHSAEAESWLEAAISSHEQLGMKWDLACDYVIFAQLMKLRDRAPEEKNCLDKSLLLFHECGAEGWCDRIRESAAEKGNQIRLHLSIPKG